MAIHPNLYMICTWVITTIFTLQLWMIIGFCCLGQSNFCILFHSVISVERKQFTDIIGCYCTAHYFFIVKKRKKDEKISNRSIVFRFPQNFCWISSIAGRCGRHIVNSANYWDEFGTTAAIAWHIYQNFRWVNTQFDTEISPQRNQHSFIYLLFTFVFR